MIKSIVSGVIAGIVANYLFNHRDNLKTYLSNKVTENNPDTNLVNKSTIIPNVTSTSNEVKRVTVVPKKANTISFNDLMKQQQNNVIKKEYNRQVKSSCKKCINHLIA